jgi:cutinase
MRVRRIPSLLAGAVVSGAVVAGLPAPIATAQACPDVEVVYARGTGENVGVGGVGQAFVDAVRGQAAPRSVSVYPVNYQASSNFDNRIEFARTVIDGIRDAGTRIETTAANCPNTRIVLGGFSQGAALAGYVTAAEVPAEVPAENRDYVPNPLPPEIANHVAAVVLIGKPSPNFLASVGAPPIVIGPSYAGKTLELCNPGDTICNGAPAAGPSVEHALYGINGSAAQGATYAVGRL